MFSISGGQTSRIRLPRRFGFILSADESGYPIEILTKAQSFPDLLPTYHLDVAENLQGVIVCSGDLRYDNLNEQIAGKVFPNKSHKPGIPAQLDTIDEMKDFSDWLRGLSLQVVSPCLENPLYAFRLCLDS